MNEQLAKRSVYLDLSNISNHTINGATIARALSGAGYGPKTQAVVPLRKDSYQVIAVDIQSAQRLLVTGIDLNGRHFDFKNEHGQDSIKVLIRGLPLDFPLEETSAFLETYGKLKSRVIQEKWQGTDILTGGHFAYMMIEKPIPGRTSIKGFKASVIYRNQPKVCFKCTMPGHLARNCSQHSYNKEVQDVIETRCGNKPDTSDKSVAQNTVNSVPQTPKPIAEDGSAAKNYAAAAAATAASSHYTSDDQPEPEPESESKLGPLVIDETKQTSREEEEEADGEMSDTPSENSLKRGLSASSGHDETPVNTPRKQERKRGRHDKKSSPATLRRRQSHRSPKH